MFACFGVIVFKFSFLNANTLTREHQNTNPLSLISINPATGDTIQRYEPLSSNDVDWLIFLAEM